MPSATVRGKPGAWSGGRCPKDITGPIGGQQVPDSALPGGVWPKNHERRDNRRSRFLASPLARTAESALSSGLRST